MVTLTNKHGTFEAETEKQAIALARKAKRDAEKEEKRRGDAYDRAHDKAAIRGYYLLDHAWRARSAGARMGRAWVLIDPTYGGHGVTVRERSTFFGAMRGHIATYEGVEFDHIGMHVVDVLADGCGWVIAVILRPVDVVLGDDSKDDVAIVGIADGAVSLRSIALSGRELRELISEPRIEREKGAT